MSTILEQYRLISDSSRFEELMELLNSVTSKGHDMVDWGCPHDSPERMELYTALTAALYDSLNLEGFEVRRAINHNIEFLESIRTDFCNTFELCFYLGELLRLVDSTRKAAELYQKARSLFPFKLALDPEAHRSSDLQSPDNAECPSTYGGNGDQTADAGGHGAHTADAGGNDAQTADADGDGSAAEVDAIITAALAQTSEYQANARNGNYGNSVLPDSGDFYGWMRLQNKIFVRSHNLQRFNKVPLFTIPFLERVLCMWNSFLQYEEELYQKLSTDKFGSQQWQEGKKQLDHVFSEVFEDLHYELMFCQGIIEVEFCADGNKYRLFELLIMIKRGIQGLEHRWNFTAGFSPATAEVIDVIRGIRGQGPVDWDNLRTWFEIADDGHLDLQIFNAAPDREYLPYGVERLQLMRLTSRLLGEMFTQFKVRYFENIDDEAEAQELESKRPSISLRELPATLKAMGIKIHLAADEALIFRDITYEAQDRCIPPNGYRSDIYAGLTVYHELLCEHARSVTLTSNMLHSDGVAFGCFFWPIAPFLENGEVTAATHRKNLDYARKLAVFMKNLKGQDFIIGETHALIQIT
ncbi:MULTISPECIES: hypothetical protein [unclassified Anaerobiospirillum]|uniref:hypothetical protein n=1 Tax=unclassified Anaerobiospirillum TaxID=2647410 RepID=UPI001FF1A2A2|nr:MULTISPECIES: hypothetical protein [unclassified Anaerobiospirillum]MCK0536038.1 hypothetical protein [Anaerobiospirillum sp. NML120511]MCK0541218.1 hypothetical protein [Anaerobiospirillum sp. NML02-A-032]